MSITDAIASSNFGQVPKNLERVMQETMGHAVPRFYKQFGSNSKQLNLLFKKNVLQEPLNEKLPETLKLDPTSVGAKEILFLHKLYNNPDSSKVTNINKDPVAVQNFQQRMLESYKMAKTTCESFVPEEKRDEKNEKVEDLARFDAPPKNTQSDEAFAKELQAQFDREIPAQEKNAPDNFGASSAVLGRGASVLDPSPILRVNEPYQLPPYSEHHIINAPMNSSISLGEGCRHIVVNATVNNSVRLGAGCRGIICNLSVNGTLQIGNNCNDIFISSNMNSSYSMGENCTNIFLDGRKIA